MSLNFQNRNGASANRVLLIVLLVISLVMATVYSREGESGPLHAIQGAVGSIAAPLKFVGASASSGMSDAQDALTDASADDATLTQLREQNAELIISAYDGLRVPKNALRVDENGVSGVYCLVGRVAYFKPVNIVYQGSDYCLVEPGTIEAATESQKSLYTLRPNDEVIVSAGELYNGKVVD